MRKKKQWILLLTIIVSAVGAYFQQSSQKSDDERVKNHQSVSFKRSGNSYNQALKILWTTVYRQGGKTLYCSASFSTKNYKERKKLANAEHVFPMSWAAKALHCGTRKKCQKRSAAFREIESDLHNIYPAVIAVNKARSNFRFADIPGEKRQFGRCDFEVDERKRLAEPTPAIRGEIARAMLYMEYQYGLPLHKKTKTLMQAWDKADAPSKEEKRRAQIIQREQGKENPFITRYPFTGR